jgi:tetratricopeptide (TPR) repeat protein
MILPTCRGPIDKAFEMSEGFPRPRWDRIAAWVAEHGGEAELWREVALGWVLRLREHLGESYTTAESAGFLLLAPGDAFRCQSLLALLERTRAWLANLGLDPRSKDDPRKVVCLVLADRETYVDFVIHRFPLDRPFVESAGMFVPEPYPHFVAKSGDRLEGTMIHELTHACVARLGLPRWVEEGLTQIVDEEQTGQPKLLADTGTLLWLRSHWRREGLGGFWHGEAFSSSEEGLRASYPLAFILAHRLLERDRDRYRRFLLAARWEDCGASALQEVFGLGPGTVAASFLGEGDWEPAPRTGAELAARGHLHAERGRLPEAVADLRAAVTEGHEDAGALNTLAWIISTCPDSALRDGPEAVRLATRACELTGWTWEPAIDTLAAAYAEIGDFARAVEYAGKAVALALPEARAGDEARLDLYRAGQPFREGTPPALSS